MSHRLYAHIILDMSGSMLPVKQQTINSVNEYINGLKVANQDATISLTVFEGTNINHIRKCVPLAQFQAIDKEYIPGGSTPLFDGIGQSLAFIQKDVKIDPDENVTLVIITDGEENSSVEYTKDSIKKVIEEKQKENWMIVYLGANQDGWSTGQSFGVRGGFSATFDTSNIAGAMADLAAKTSTYNSVLRSTSAYGLAGAEYNDVDRAKLVEKKKI